MAIAFCPFFLLFLFVKLFRIIKMTTKRGGHKAADAMDWDEALRLIDCMFKDGLYRNALLFASGCYLGLRVSDLLLLHWADLLSEEFILKEQKTRKQRTLRVNEALRIFTESCWKELGRPPEDAFIFVPKNGVNPISRQAVDRMLKKARIKYQVNTAKVFSSHTMRKTFGRRVWLQECDKGRGEQALVLLCDVYGHSSVAITKRYLGIRQDEILSIYDALNG